MRKSELRDIIAFAERIIKKDKSVSILEMLVYENGKMLFTDLCSYIEINVGELCNQPFAINKEQFKKMLKGKDVDARIKFNSIENKLHITTDTGSKAIFENTYSEEKIPRLKKTEEINKRSYLFKPEVMELISQAMNHTSDDELRGVITNVLISKDIVGTNRIALYFAESGLDDINILVPKTVLKGVCWLSNKWDVKVESHDNGKYLEFWNPEVSIRFIMDSATFPDYRKAIPKLNGDSNKRLFFL